MKYISPLNVNTSISQGQQIGQVGSTGNSSGPHLHFEVWIGSTRVDPLPYLQGAGEPGSGGGTVIDNRYGSLDAVTSSFIAGWSWDPNNAHNFTNAHVYIYDSNGIKIRGYNLREGIFRQDLFNKGYGHGHHTFELHAEWTYNLSPGIYTIRVYAVHNDFSAKLIGNSFYRIT